MSVKGEWSRLARPLQAVGACFAPRCLSFWTSEAMSSPVGVQLASTLFPLKLKCIGPCGRPLLGHGWPSREKTYLCKTDTVLPCVVARARGERCGTPKRGAAVGECQDLLTIL